MTKLNEAEQLRATGNSIVDVCWDLSCIEHGIQLDERDPSNKTFGGGRKGSSAFCFGSGAGIARAQHFDGGQVPPAKTAGGGGDAFDTFSSEGHAWQPQRMPSCLHFIQTL